MPRLGPALGAWAALVATCTSFDVRADLTMPTSPPAGCPGASFFAEEANRRALKGATTVAISRENAEFIGKIWFLDGPGPEAREVRGPTCEGVAETLVLIAEVHERPATGPMPASAILFVPPPAPPASVSSAPYAPRPGAAGPPALEPPPPDPARGRDLPAKPPRVFAGGAGALLDTAVVPSLASGGMIFGRYTPSASTMRTRGWATLSVGYLAGSVDVGGVHVTHRRWFGRATAVPYAWPFARDARVGLAAFATLARLGVKADVPAARDDARPTVDVGLGPRLLTVLGPSTVELGADLILSVSRRRFVLPEREEPVFRLPAAAFGAFLAVGSR